MAREGKHRGETPSEMKNWVSLLKDHNTRIKLLSQQEKDLKIKAKPNKWEDKSEK